MCVSMMRVEMRCMCCDVLLHRVCKLAATAEAHYQPFSRAWLTWLIVWREFGGESGEDRRCDDLCMPVTRLYISQIPSLSDILQHTNG